MKTNLKRVLAVAGFAIAFSMIALPLSAQQARFTLTHEVHWGSAVLPPGDYKLSGPTATESPFNVMYIYGNGESQMAMPTITEPRPESNKSYLRLVNVSGTYVVREFNSGVRGRTYLFPIPKTLRLKMTPAQEQQISTLIDVSGQ